MLKSPTSLLKRNRPADHTRGNPMCPPGSSIQTRAQRVNQAARALVDANQASCALYASTLEFRSHAAGLDLRTVIAAAIQHLQDKRPDLPHDRLAGIAWSTAEQLFGWVDLDRLEPRGHA
jgi:hypothetical protein